MGFSPGAASFRAALVRAARALTCALPSCARAQVSGLQVVACTWVYFSRLCPWTATQVRVRPRPARALRHGRAGSPGPVPGRATPSSPQSWAARTCPRSRPSPWARIRPEGCRCAGTRPRLPAAPAAAPRRARPARERERAAAAPPHPTIAPAPHWNAGPRLGLVCALALQVPRPRELGRQGGSRWGRRERRSATAPCPPSFAAHRPAVLWFARRPWSCGTLRLHCVAFVFGSLSVGLRQLRWWP